MMLNEETVKFCKDCKHGKPDWLFGWGFGKCRVNAISKLDLVSGKKTSTVRETYCENERAYGCGPEAKLFEPKKKRGYLCS